MKGRCGKPYGSGCPRAGCPDIWATECNMEYSRRQINSIETGTMPPQDGYDFVRTSGSQRHIGPEIETVARRGRD